MSYVIKNADPVVNLKLTDLGREKISEGDLNFTYFQIGDSEINYIANDYSSLNILGPKDKNPDLSYPIRAVGSDSTSYFNRINSVQSVPHISYNTATERGIFDKTNHNTFDKSLPLVTALKLKPSGYTGTNSITLHNDSDTVVNDNRLHVGDYIMLRVNDPRSNTDLDPYEIKTQPLPVLWFEIRDLSAGNVTGNTVTFEIDRNLPDFDITNFSGFTQSGDSVAYIFPGNNAITDYYDKQLPGDYWPDDVLSFSSACTNIDTDVPIWNMNIIALDNMIGVHDLIHKNIRDSIGFNYSGIFTYLRYYTNQPQLNKIAALHYTNNTVGNFYGEGFYKDTLKIHIPWLLWHESTTDSMGYTFETDSTLKTIENEIKYYDLIDAANNIVVGKVFPELKLVVIEQQEIVSALSYKSNRNWTLPKLNAITTEAGICQSSNNDGVLQSTDEELCITYMLSNASGFTSFMPCEEYTRVGIESGVTPPRDVLVSFPDKFPYMSKNIDGWNADTLHIFYQKVPMGADPSPDSWKFFNANFLIGSNGCAESAPQITDTFELYTQTKHISTNDLVTKSLGNFNVLFYPKTKYKLDKKPIGDVIVSVNGNILKEAANEGEIYDFQQSIYANSYSFSDPQFQSVGDYVYRPDYNEVTFKFTEDSKKNPNEIISNLQLGDIIQLHYLVGNTVASETIEQSVVVPSTISADTSGTIYENGGNVYMDLDEKPHCGFAYVFYNGQVLDSSQYYDVENSNQRIKLTNFTPQAGSRFVIYYLNKTAGGGDPNTFNINPTQLVNTNVYINNQIDETFATDGFNLNDFISIPSSDNTQYMSFGDETFFPGNLETDIMSTTYETTIDINILPNRFVVSDNPTFNELQHKVAYSELGIYDENKNLICIGKFSQPIKRKLNSDNLIIRATIDF